MGIDYYGILNIEKCASKSEIKQGYRRLALEFHPAKPQQDERKHVIFSLIGEAYDVLSDNLHRAVYDQYGEEGLKAGVPGPRHYIQPYIYHGDPIRTFEEFFGKENPFTNLLDVLIHPLPLYVVGNHIGVKKKSVDVSYPLPLTLKEVYYGGFKQVLFQRRELLTTAQGEPAITRTTEIMRTIQFGPGIPPGTEFRFSEAGNQAPDIIPGDVIFVTEDKPHETFRREGLSLQTKRAPKLEHQNSGNQFAIHIDKHIDEIHTESNTFQTHFPTPMPHLSTVICISLSQALTGFIAKVKTIDGRTLRIPITEIVSPSYEKIIQREGLPVFGVEDGRRGILRMRFDIKFPIYPFPSKCRLSLKKALTSGIMKSEEKEFDDSVMDEVQN